MEQSLKVFKKPRKSTKKNQSEALRKILDTPKLKDQGGKGKRMHTLMESRLTKVNTIETLENWKLERERFLSVSSTLASCVVL